MDKRVIWVDGNLHSRTAPVIAGTDRSFTLGEGIFETMAVVNGIIWKLNQHIQRLNDGINRIHLGSAFNREMLQNILVDLIQDESVKEGVFRLTLSAGPGERGMVHHQKEPVVVATFDPLKVGDFQGGGSAVSWMPDHRNPHLLTSWIKSTNYLDLIDAKRTAQSAGFDDALLGNHQRQMVCCTSSNLLFWDGVNLMTPSIGSGALPGTTIQWLAAQKLPVRLVREDVSFSDLHKLVGLYKINSLHGLQPLDKVDGLQIPSSSQPILDELRRAIKRGIEAECGHIIGQGHLPWLEAGPHF
jgi:branched-chain amino acid aminotransferase